MNVSTTAILIPAAGSGARFGGKKQFVELAGKPILQRTLEVVRSLDVDQVVVATTRDAFQSVQDLAQRAGLAIDVTEGGETRAHSVRAALGQVREGLELVAVHDAARPLASRDLFERVLEAAARSGAAVAAVPVADTLKRSRGGEPAEIESTISREGLWAVQTPQAFTRGLLERAYAQDLTDATDEAMLVEKLGHAIELVPGEVTNRKITTIEDLALAARLLSSPARVGIGRDRHPLEPGRPLVLCGLTVEGAPSGPVGHSDGDVLSHAIADAVLGAAGAGDLGGLFPDDADWTAGISGDRILEGAAERAAEAGLVVSNVDATIWLAAPRLAGILPEVRTRVAAALGVDASRVNLKAKSGNDIAEIGNGTATEAEAIASLAENESGGERA